MMLRTIVILFVVIVAAIGDEREKCMEIFRHQSVCCDIDDFMSLYEGECKVDSPRTDGSDARKPYIFSCTFDECIFDKNKLLSSDKSINEEAVSKFLDNYTVSHPTASSAIADVTEYCLNGKYKEYVPTSVCESVQFGICAVSNLAMECPKRKDSADCSSVAKVTEECKRIVNEEMKRLPY